MTQKYFLCGRIVRGGVYGIICIGNVTDVINCI